MLLDYVERVFNARMCFKLIIDVASLVVGVVVVDLAELNSRGWPIYRGNAAQISVELCVSLEIRS